MQLADSLKTVSLTGGNQSMYKQYPQKTYTVAKQSRNLPDGIR
jgi:hypothetical protein